MYETFFGFRKRPFLSSPTLDRYFPSDEMERAFRTVAHSIDRADGPVAIMGNSGTGKSLLGLRIADSWRKNYEVILLSSSKFCTRRALLQCLLFELRMPYRDLSEGELRLSLQERLQLSMENPSDGLILIVDEAQSLNLKLLEELRMLTNLARDGQPRVRLILIGTPRLDELLGHSRMESLNQRLAARCYLHSLPYDEARRYLQHKVELGGVDCGTVFTEDALRAIHRAADGVPRLLDQIADHSLRHAASVGQRPIAASLVEQAWANLQQLPSPWMDPLPIETPNAIEFGPLDLDEESDAIDFESMEPLVEHYEDIEASTEPSGRFEASESESVESDSYRESEIEDHWLPKFEPNPCSTYPDVEESNMLDEIFQGSSAFISTNCYDLDEAVTIGDFVEPAQPRFHEELLAPEAKSLPQFPPSQPSTARAANPFGDDFEEETPVTLTSSNFALESVEAVEEYRLQPISPIVNSTAIQIEEIEDILHLDERAIENEIREMISSLHLAPSNLDIDQENIADEAPSAESISTEETVLEPVSHAGSQVLSFASLGSGKNKALGDDRDILVIEENIDVAFVDSDSVTVTGSVPESRTMHTPFSYVQLFSKLRS